MTHQTIELMLRHRSIRRFSDQPVSDSLLSELVECGLRASNTGNMQLYSVIATREEPLRSELLKFHFNQCSSAPLLLTVCTDVHRYHRYCQVNQCDQPYGNLLWMMSALVDASLFAQNLCLAAEARGLGFCHLGTVMYNTPEIAALLHCPEGVVPVIALALGFPAEEGRLSERIGPDGVLHSEVYHPYSDDDIRRIHAVRDTDPFNLEMVRQNGTRNYCEIFTTKRYPRTMNESVSQKLEDFLRQAGMMDKEN
ncbi:MAG: nitroreductase family protein [Bacteroidales bacterium]|nr:nitroreductase family protein [Bacteroidales bacterium]MDY6370786.1 nitroreductase family protein [Bacteroidales bacterium]